jgi:hypothetical protein
MNMVIKLAAVGALVATTAQAQTRYSPGPQMGGFWQQTAPTPYQQSHIGGAFLPPEPPTYPTFQPPELPPGVPQYLPQQRFNGAGEPRQ